MFLLLKELSPPDGLPARTHPLGRGVFNETPSHVAYLYSMSSVEESDVFKMNDEIIKTIF